MEFINEHIDLEIETKIGIDNSFCETKQDENYIYLTFGIFANDCLFDLLNTNYEVYVRISKKYLEKYRESLNLVAERQMICCNIQSKLLEVINCRLRGIQRKIFLESEILFLLYQTQKNSLVFQLKCDSCNVLVRPIETEKIQQAKKFILENLSDNLNTPKIALHVGTNQCYLKKGFKEIYNQTIFEFIQENRMIKAKYFIETTDLNATEIAFRVGYSSLSSFSQSYKNYFGISPNDQAKAVFTKN